MQHDMLLHCDMSTALTQHAMYSRNSCLALLCLYDPPEELKNSGTQPLCLSRLAPCYGL